MCSCCSKVFFALEQTVPNDHLIDPTQRSLPKSLLASHRASRRLYLMSTYTASRVPAAYSKYQACRLSSSLYRYRIEELMRC